MPHKSVAVVAAMRRELASLLRGVRGRKEDGVEFFELETALVAVGGIGFEAARRATEAVVARYKPSLIVSAGVAGALSTSLCVGDVVQAGEVIDAESGTRVSALGGESVIVTVSSVSGAVAKSELVARWKADVVDMEAAAVAEVSRNYGIEFAAIKAISDESAFTMPPVGEFVDEAGQFETLRFTAHIAVRPKWWLAVRQLSSNSRKAAANLSVALEHLIDQRSMISVEEKITGA